MLCSFARDWQHPFNLTTSHPLSKGTWMFDREYGSLATLGIVVPQANTTVEPEMAALMPDGVSMLISRLQGSRVDSRNRLVQYLDNLASTLDDYDTAPLDAVGYACTATSYIIGKDDEERRIGEFSEKFGYPIFTAAQAIRAALTHLGARKVALFAPYPPWAVEASQVYWEKAGFELTDTKTVSLDTTDTRHVYRVRTDMVLDSVKDLNWAHADAIILTGTGVPTLRSIGEISARSGKPVLSSNLCLAWYLMKQLKLGASLPPPGPGESLYGGWIGRIRA